jgi:hypothetical protein
MNRLLLMAASVLAVSSAAFLWVVNAPSPGTPPAATFQAAPTPGQPKPKTAGNRKNTKPAAPAKPPGNNPAIGSPADKIVKQINLELNRQKQRISADQKSKKLTAQQAKSLSANLKALYGQIPAYIKGSPDHSLSPEQASVIYQQVQNNGQSIP